MKDPITPGAGNSAFALPGGLRRGARYDSIFYGAYAGPGATFDIRVRFRFKQRLRPEKLRAAAARALENYPEFAVRPVLYNGRVCYEKNAAGVLVCPDDGRRRYFGADGEDGTNGYLFVFLYGERHVTLSMFHGLTDARGMISYVISVLWYYLKALYPVAGLVRPRLLTDNGIRLDRAAFDAMEDEERYDPLTKFAAPGAPVDLIDPARLFRLPKETYDREETRCRLLNLEISNTAFVKKTKELGTSFAPLLAALTGKAIAGMADIGDKQISVVVTADARRFFRTRSLGNMAYNCPLPMDREDLALPLERLCAKLKADLARQTTEENAARTFSFILSQCDEIDAMGSIDDVNRALTGPGGLETLTTNGTLFLTYPGRVDSNPISRVLLEGVTPGMLAMERAVVAYAHRDSLIIQVTQKSDDLSLIEAIRTTLAQNGLEAKLHDMGRVTQNIFDFSRIKRAE